MIRFDDAARAMAGECLCFRARRTARTLTRFYDEALRPFGVQTSQLLLLAAIASGREDGVPMRALAEVLAMDRTTLSRNVRPLEKSGWVRVARSPADARVRLLLLTPAGQRLIERAFPVWAEVNERVAATLGTEVAVGLRERLDEVVAAFGGTQ